jgi:hypothetical protein
MTEKFHGGGGVFPPPGDEKTEATRQRILKEVVADVVAGKITNDEAVPEIDRRMIDAGVKKKSEPPWGTIIMYDGEAQP